MSQSSVYLQANISHFSKLVCSICSFEATLKAMEEWLEGLWRHLLSDCVQEQAAGLTDPFGIGEPAIVSTFFL